MFNPVRRNRNIGKTQGGRVTDGKAVEKWSRFFGHGLWRKLSDHTEGAEGYRGFEENPSKGFYHPCSLGDYLSLLDQLPEEVSRRLKAIILRRTPTADQKLGIEARRRFSCVIINSFPRDNRMVWTNPPSQATIRHYNPWCSNWTIESNTYFLEWSLEEIRRYYLFHLFLHELGHINQPSYHALKRRESFAEDFALSWARQLGILP